MTIDQYIRDKYAELIGEFGTIKHQCKELYGEEYIDNLREHIYVQSVVSISGMLGSPIPAMFESSFHRTLNLLIQNCMLHEETPVTTLNDAGYGYEDKEYHKQLQWIMQFQEGFIRAQSPKWDVIHWVELGIKLKLLNLTK